MSLNIENIFSNLWDQYVALNPDVQKIHDLFVDQGHKVVNDHVALRTFNHPKVNCNRLAQTFLKHGYAIASDYEFAAKKLDAIHLEHKGDPSLPKVFISELKLECFSEKLRAVILPIIDRIDSGLIESESFLYSGRTWSPLLISEYESLLLESEYAAWVATFGYMANHFTVKINDLGKSLATIGQVNDFIEGHGYQINANGGKVKGSPEVFLEQSATLANRRSVQFSDGTKVLPTCFYEFAYRYDQEDGKQFSGFIADNADKIFTSTNVNQ